MGKFCLYADNKEAAPCLTMKAFKYSYLQEFLSGFKGPEQNYDVPTIGIKCLTIENNKPSIFNNNCINCMFCIFGCFGNKIIISKNLYPTEFCSDISKEQRKELHENLIFKLFQGNFISLPSIPFSNFEAKYKTFEEFTKIAETENIAPWGANAMKYLSSSLEPRISLEVGLKIENRDRNGRLDISLLNIKDNFLFLAETKTSFSTMMSENRYESQLLGYESEIQKVCPKELKKCKFLLIGGNESDLLPQNHPDCTSRKGNKSNEFYNIIKKHNFFFISANAMLALGLMKLFVSYEKYNLENLYPIIIDPKYVGLLSSGVVDKEGKIISLDII